MFKKTPQRRVLFVHRLLPVLLVLFGVFFCLSAFGQTSQRAYAATNSTINFQAKLMSAAGAIAPDGNYNVEFKLYNASTSSGSTQGSCTGDAACQWVETRNGANQVQVKNGYLTVNLGSVTAFPSTINWDQQLWITMNIGGTNATPSWDGEMNPRLTLTGVPYAFRAGSLAQYNSSTGFTSTLNLVQPTVGNQIFQIPDQGAAGTYSLLTTNAANSSFIQLQGSSPGTPQTGNMNISGTAIANKIQAATFDASSAGTLSIGLTSGGTATSISLNQNTTLAAGDYIRIAGSSTRPSSPTAGTLYYDTSTNQLIKYNGSKWISAPRSNTLIVAASNSSQAEKDSADYVATGTGDQTMINTALTALPSGGGSVYLMEGTYTVSAPISVPDNTTLSGAGAATIITIPNAQNGTYAIIQNTDTAGANVVIQNMLIDGNKANQTSGSMYGIKFSMPSASSTSIAGKVQNVTAQNLYGSLAAALYVSSTNNLSISNSFFTGTYYGIQLSSGGNNVVANNIVNSNTQAGIVSVGSNSNTITGNSLISNSPYSIFLQLSNSNAVIGNGISTTSYGVYVQTGAKNNISSNTIQSSGAYGITLQTATYTAVASNLITNAGAGGVLLYSNSVGNIISANKIHDSGGTATNEGIQIQDNSANNNNSFIGNDITDTSCTSNCYAIDILYPAAKSTYISNNNISGTTANAASINDLGSGTVYANQADSSGNLINKSQGGGFTIGAGTASASLNVQGGTVSSQLPTPAQPTITETGGTAGTAVYGYKVTALDGTGETVGSTEGQITNGYASLSSTAYAIITWTPMPGAVQYKIYRTTVTSGSPTSLGLLTTVSGNVTSYNDKATAATTTSTPPTANTTGGTSIQGGSLNVTASSAVAITVQGASGQDIFSLKDSSSVKQAGVTSNGAFWSNGGFITYDATSGNSNALTMRSGNASAGSSGNVTIASGTAAGSGNASGNISIDTGSVSSGATAGSISVGSTNASSITVGKTASNITTTIQGTAVIKPTTSHDSTTAFQIQNASGSSLLTADTTNMAINISNGWLNVNGLTAPTAPTIALASGGALVNGTTYYYMLAAVDASGHSVPTPSSPASVTATATSDTVNVSWTAVSGATSYYLYRSTDGGTTWYRNTIAGGSTVSATDNGTNFTWGGTNYANDQAYNTAAQINVAAGGSIQLDTAGNSKILEGGLDHNLYIDNFNAGKGISLQASNLSFTNTVDFSTNFSIASTGAALFKQRSGQDSTTAFQIQNASGTSLLTGDTTNMNVTLAGGSLYVNAVANPAAPTLATASTGGSLTAATYYYKLAAIGQTGATTTTAISSSPASVTTAGTTSVNTLSWMAVSGATGYAVYRSTNNTTWYLNTVSAATTSLTDNGTNFFWSSGAYPASSNSTGGIKMQSDTLLTVDAGSGSSNAGIGYSTTYGSLNITNGNTNGQITLNSNGATSINSSSFSWIDSFQNTDFSLGTSGQALFKNSSNSTTAFQIQNSSNFSLFTADTTNKRVNIGTAGTFVTPSITGSMSFTPRMHQTLSSGSSVPVSTTIDDNGDGIPDLAAVVGNTVQIYLGNGDGTFQTTSTQSITGFTSPDGLVVGDFNKDGKPDLAIIDGTNATMAVMLHATSGNGFNSATGSPYALTSAGKSIYTGDFNGDGNLDIAVANSTAFFSVFLGSATGAFTQATGSPISLPTVPNALAIADFNHDNKLDVVATSSSSFNMYELTGKGDGTFNASTTIYSITTCPGGSCPTVGFGGIVAADMNSDGWADLVYITNGYNNGTTQYPKVSVALNSSGTFTFGSSTQYFPGYTTMMNGIAAADFNGDGKQDIVVAGQNTDTTQTAAYGYVLTGDGAGNIASPTSLYTYGNMSSGVSVADLDSDGRTDIIFADGASSGVDIYRNTSIFAASSVTGSSTLSLTGQAASDVTLGLQAISGQTADLLHAQNSAGSMVFQISASGDVAIQRTSGVALQVSNASGSSLMRLDTNAMYAQFGGTVTVQSNSPDSFVVRGGASVEPEFRVDTTNHLVRIGSDSSVSSNTTLLVLGVQPSSTSTDPSGPNGSMYYNASSNSFRCYQGGSWRNCLNGPTNTVTSIGPLNWNSGSVTSCAAGAPPCPAWSTNRVYVQPIYLPGPMTVNTMCVYVTSALGAAGDVGMYDSSGTMVADGGSGSLTTTTGKKCISNTASYSSTVLQPGQYYFAVTWASNTGEFVSVGIDTTYNVSMVSHQGYVASTGGAVLPSSASVGSITTMNYAPYVVINGT